MRARRAQARPQASPGEVELRARADYRTGEKAVAIRNLKLVARSAELEILLLADPSLQMDRPLGYL